MIKIIVKEKKIKFCKIRTSVLFFLSLSILTFFSCSKKNSNEEKSNIKNNTESELNEKTENDFQRVLPQTEKPKSMLMSESPITPRNIDDFLFRNDCIYIDLRSSETFYKEGHIAGFTNVPFYGYIADFPNNHTSLFKMTKQGGIYLGDVGSFLKNYEEAEQIIYETFSKEKNIIAISTAGVESCYFLNLLLQLGYDENKLYNAGSFTNGMGNDIAYRTYASAKYLVQGLELVDARQEYTFSTLTKIK